ncbi:MAG: glutamate--tRNA ligase [Candidatus Woesearchaeota archaeon]
MEKKELERQITIAALENAVKFSGKPKQGTIIGKLFSLEPELKKDMKNISPMISKIMEEVSSMNPEEQKKRLLELDPGFNDKEKEKKEKRKKEARELPPLKDAKEGEVVTRMPPGPSKHPHIGHAISFGINYLYAREYDGKCILRFDDTNPEVEKQEFVNANEEDIIDYLGFKPDSIVFASDLMDELYAYADDLIEQGRAYACSCPSEIISESRKEMEGCQHREQDKNETYAIWEGMKEGTNTEYALRLKIDMEHKNAVMRDPVIFRVIDSPHYRQGKKYKAWPTYDFESPIVDGICGITHVLRSNEFDSRIELHHHLAEILGFSKIPYKHYGRVNITGSLTKGREIRSKIDNGDFIGWDDPRLVTLKALRRRGITRDAIINIVKMAGLSKQNTNIDFSVIAAENRKILDAESKRYFFIEEPHKVKIKGAPKQEIMLKSHPASEKRERKFSTGEEFLIEEKDLKALKEGKMSRLMDCLNFKVDGGEISFHSSDISEYKKSGDKIIHWLPAEGNITTDIMMPDGSMKSGLAEKNIKDIKEDSIIQFERFGFCRLDKKEKDRYIFWYTHD